MTRERLPGKHHVVFVLPNMGFGGAQRVASLVANYLIDEGHSVSLALTSLSPKGDEILHRLDERIELISLGEKWSGFGGGFDSVRGLAFVVWRFRQVLCCLSLRSLLRRSKPDVVMSFLVSANVWTLLATRLLGCRVVVSERNDPGRQQIGAFYRVMRRLLYRHADLVTSNSPIDASTAMKHLGVSECQVVPNVLELARTDRVSEKDPRRIVFVGRLVAQKDVPTLLRTVRMLADLDREWRLDVVGDGPARSDLESLCRELSLDGIVRFHGYLDDPSRYLHEAVFLVQPSLHEGTPNAVLEAMAHGVTCLVADSSPGPRQLIEQVSPSLIFETGNATALFRIIRDLSESPDEVARLSIRSMEVAKAHSWNEVRERWFECLGFDDQAAPAVESK